MATREDVYIIIGMVDGLCRVLVFLFSSAPRIASLVVEGTFSSWNKISRDAVLERYWRGQREGGLVLTKLMPTTTMSPPESRGAEMSAALGLSLIHI